MPRKSTDIRRLKSQEEEAAWYATPVADLERAKRIAEETGVGYQTVLKQAIRRGLMKAG
jgi:hypothetical protein